jgi:hypothetical protein
VKIESLERYSLLGELATSRPAPGARAATDSSETRMGA